MRVSPSLANRLIETAKGLLLKFLPDVYIYVDHQKGPNAGLYVFIIVIIWFKLKE